MEKVANTFQRIMSRKGIESPIEKKMVFELERVGFECVNQLKISTIRVDIAIPKFKMIVECDGRDYHLDKEKDRIRDQICSKYGWEVVRFTGTEIFMDAPRLARELAIRLGIAKETIEQCKICTMYEEECVCNFYKDY